MGNINNYLESTFDFLSSIITLIISAVIVFSAAPFVVVVTILLTIPTYLIDRNYMAKIWNYHKDTTEERRSVRLLLRAFFLIQANFTKSTSPLAF